MTDLYQRSIEIILANQHPSGAYVASPNFPTYHYCWFRDGSLIAYAMDLAGHPESAARFHAWAARAVNRRSEVIRRGVAKAANGQPLDAPAGVLGKADILHTRLTLEGEDGTQEEWANFQLDGFGTWLWALEQHRRLTGLRLPPDWLEAAGRVADYLAALWRHPCFDLWEEFGDKVHPYTLSAIYGGLKAYEDFTAENGEEAEDLLNKTSALSASSPGTARQGRCVVNSVLAEIKAYIEEHFVCGGHFVKFEGRPEVDASLLGLGVPYGVVPPGDPRLPATVAEIERTLHVGGVHRYSADTYYGGGEWILLAAWLGWYYARLDAPDSPAKIAQILAWIESQAGPDGSLPEQVPANLNDPAYYPTWLAKWGPIANPLLWSHAEYIILKTFMLSGGL